MIHNSKNVSKTTCFSTFLVILLYYSLVSGILITSPENRFAVLGETIQFNCSTDQLFSVNWKHIPLGSRSASDVYISKVVVSPYIGRFSLERKKFGGNVTEYNLIITQLQKEDAGTFICIDHSGMGQREEAQLTVIETLPSCSTNIGSNGFIGDNDCGHQPETIQCSCTLEYTGNVAPEMQWMVSKKDTVQTNPITNRTGNSVSSELKINATRSVNGALVKWQSSQSIRISWMSKPIKILYAKKSLSSEILRSSKSVTCNGDSSEICSYTWIARIHPNTELQSFEQQTITVNRPGTYRCDALCPLRHAHCTVTSLHVEYINENDKHDVIVLLIMGVPLAICIIVIIVYGVLFLKHLKNRRKRPRN